jgi:hypothetical protein
MSASPAYEPSPPCTPAVVNGEHASKDEKVSRLYAVWERVHPQLVAQGHAGKIAAVQLNGTARIFNSYIEAMDAVPGALYCSIGQIR